MVLNVLIVAMKLPLEQSFMVIDTARALGTFVVMQTNHHRVPPAMCWAGAEARFQNLQSTLTRR